MADMNLMSALTGKERTEGELHELIQSAGLKLCGIWKYADETGDSIIVASPVDQAPSM